MTPRDDPLTEFGERIVSLCRSNGIEPILYGSYRLRELLDEEICVNDIDFYVHEDDFKTIIRTLFEAGIEHRFDEQHHTLQAFDDDLRIEFDSIEFWYTGSYGSVSTTIGSEPVRALSRASLEHVYERAAQRSSEPERYHEKLSLLRDER